MSLNCLAIKTAPLDGGKTEVAYYENPGILMVVHTVDDANIGSNNNFLAYYSNTIFMQLFRDFYLRKISIVQYCRHNNNMK